MTTRNRNFVRTPRRRKLFVQYNSRIDLGSGTSTPKAENMLTGGLADIGVNTIGGLTVMDVRGQIQLTGDTALASTAQSETIRCGYNWLDPNVANAGDGDGQIPEPLLLGLRESKWIQQWQLAALEPDSGGVVLVGGPLIPLDQSLIQGIYVKNMRKQPSADSILTFVISGGSTWEANTVSIEIALLIMLALP